MRYVVGYTPSDRGADAVALASALARAQGHPWTSSTSCPYFALHPEGSGVSTAEQKMITAEREGLSLVPKDGPSSTSATPTRTPQASLIRPWRPRPV